MKIPRQVEVAQQLHIGKNGGGENVQSHWCEEWEKKVQNALCEKIDPEVGNPPDVYYEQKEEYWQDDMVVAELNWLPVLDPKSPAGEKIGHHVTINESDEYDQILVFWEVLNNGFQSVEPYDRL